MRKFESSQIDESRTKSADSWKDYRKPKAGVPKLYLTMYTTSISVN